MYNNINSSKRDSMNKDKQNKIGQLVMSSTETLVGHGDQVPERISKDDLALTHGIIFQDNVNMWGEEVVPTGIRILWS